MGGQIETCKNTPFRLEEVISGWYWIFLIGLIVGGPLIVGCGSTIALVLPNEVTDSVDSNRFELLTRFVQISDAQIVDEESPARLTVGAPLSNSAWRPQEAYSIHLLDGMVRTVNKMHVARHPIDFVIHTGDATDNIQQNELAWFITAMDGGLINPLSGVDDRLPQNVPIPLLDPHATFTAQGLYENGVHGPLPTIAWYAVVGNHDHFAVGVFPIVTTIFGNRVSPMPLPNRIPLSFPALLDPLSNFTIGLITPANPGPPMGIQLPIGIVSNPMRRFLTSREFVEAHLQSLTQPRGHGFDPGDTTKTWYSVSPVPGLRLIELNSATPLLELPTLNYSEGAISFAQVSFLRSELAKAQAAGETVVVATHHPSGSLDPVHGTALTPWGFRTLLNAFPCVKLHIAGHWHVNLVLDRGGYTEMLTSSIIDLPQEGRVIEIWRDRADSATIELRYSNFSHLEGISPPDATHANLFADPLLPLRNIAAQLADRDQ